jgi:protein required for attachment to host cells
MEINEWVVVASKAQAKIFRRTATNRPLTWVYNLVNEESRLSSREFATERPTLDADKFARQIAGAIKVGIDQHVFTKLHVFAEPHFLGRIKKNAPKSLKNIHVNWIGKDLEKATTEEILERVP